ncbi:MAG: phosphoglycerate kinase [Acidobacteriota bacterium]
MPKLSIRDLDLQGKRLFIRVDFNVPIEDGRISDAARIEAALPTIRLALEKNAKVILASHLGRPKGTPEKEYSLKPVADRLSSLLDRQVYFVNDCIGPTVDDRVKAMDSGHVVLLENLRFHAGETKNDPEFARELAALAQEYVNDAFGTAHRAHASTVGVPQVLGGGAAGLLMEKELEYLARVLFQPEAPVVAILGGAKVSDKMDVIENFLRLANSILLGGGMAFTFFKAQGINVGRSLVEEDKLGVARELIRRSEAKGIELKLPVDVVAAPRMEQDVETREVAPSEIPEEWMGLDIGSKTTKEYKKIISKAKTVIWNGPMGVFEIKEFSRGTTEIARAVADSEALSVVGGGDSAAAVRKAQVAEKISHISTGGGASLEFLAGKTLPGVEILTKH